MRFPDDEIETDLNKLIKASELAGTEMEKMFARIERKSGETEYISSLREDYAKRLQPHIEKVNELSSK
jgi:hypothetical protein